jgi:chromosome segregation ATPase
MSVAAEIPNRAVLQAKQEAYDQVTLQAQIELGKQMAEYEEQRKRMAAEHERCLKALKQENQRMIKEAVRVRQEYANAFMSSKTPSVEEIEEAQSRHHYQTLREKMTTKEKRLIDESAREKKKRLQKEQELADAEEQIEKLRKDLNFLEETLESGNKRSIPARSRSDSPNSPDNKRSKLDEQTQDCQTAEAQIKPIQTSEPQVPTVAGQDKDTPGQIELAQSNPVASNKRPQVQTQSDQTPNTQSSVEDNNQTPKVAIVGEESVLRGIGFKYMARQHRL